MIVLALNERDYAGDQAWPWMRAAELALADSSDDATKAAVHATRLTLLARQAEPGVWKLLDRLPQQADDPEVLRQTTRALYNVGEIAMDLGHDSRAQALLAESRKLAQRSGIPYLEAYCQIVLIRLVGLAGRWSDLEERFTALRVEFPDVAMVSLKQNLLFGVLAAARGQRTVTLEQFKAAAFEGEEVWR